MAAITLQDSIRTICAVVGDELKKYITNVFQKHSARRGYRWRQNIKRKVNEASRKAENQTREKYCDLEDEYFKEVQTLKKQLKQKTDKVNELTEELEKVKEDVRYFSKDYAIEQQKFESKIANLEKFYLDIPRGWADQQNVNVETNEAQQPTITFSNSSVNVNTKTLGRKHSEEKHGSSVKRKRKRKK